MIRVAIVLVLTATQLHAQDRLSIAAVNAPLASFAETLGGDAVEVIYPVPEGADAAFWRPPIAVISEIQQADIILLNGAEFAKWTAKTSLPRSRIVTTSAAFSDALIETTEGVTHSHGNEGEHSHTGLAALTWLDFDQATRQAEAVAEAIVRKRPDLETPVAEALATLRAELAALDARAITLGGAFGETPIIALHSGYEYFVRAYDLNLRQVTWPQGEDPDTAMLSDLEDLLADHPAKLALWPDPPTKAAAEALESRGIPSVVLPTGANIKADFVEAMTAGLDALEAAIP